ncbi:hypothetical protein Tco_0001589 [Tanacetum coccineum]
MIFTIYSKSKENHEVPLKLVFWEVAEEGELLSTFEITNFSKIAKPPTSTDSEETKYEWGQRNKRKPFLDVEGQFCEITILSFLLMDPKSCSLCDASNQGLGEVSQGKNSDTSKNLRGLDQLIERKENGGMDKTYYVLRNMKVVRLKIPDGNRNRINYGLLLQGCQDKYTGHGSALLSIILNRDGIIPSSYHSSIRCAPFKALHGSVVLIKEKLKAARDRQKSYADNRRKLLEFEVEDQVLLKVSPWTRCSAFGKKDHV